jgi:hypothetical protein
LPRKRLRIWPLKRPNYGENQERRRKLLVGLGGLGLPAWPAAFSTVGAVIGPHAGPPDTAGRAQSIAHTRAQRGRPPSLRLGPLSGPTLCRLGWRAALKVLRAFAPSVAGRFFYDGGLYRAPRCAAWVGGPRSKYRAHSRPAWPAAFSAAGAFIGPHAGPPGLAGRAQSIARTCAQRGRPPSLRLGPLSGPTLCRLCWRAALKVLRTLAPSVAGRFLCGGGFYRAPRRLCWGAALKVSRALAPSVAGRFFYGWGFYLAPRWGACVGGPRSKFRGRSRPAWPAAFSAAGAFIGPRAAWVGGPRSKFRGRSRPAWPVAFSTAGAFIGPRAVPPGLAGRAQSFARTRAQRGRSLSLRRGPLSGPAPGRLGWMDALKVSRTLAPSVAVRFLCGGGFYRAPR